MAAAPTRDGHDSDLRERALGPVVTNLSMAPFWLVPFTVLVSVLTKDENDPVRLQVWVGSAVVSTIVISIAITAYRHRDGGPTPSWIVTLLRAGMVLIGVTIGISAWVAGRAPIEMVMLFAVFPTTAGAVNAMLTAGRRDLYMSVLMPMAALSTLTLATSADMRVAWSCRAVGLLRGDADVDPREADQDRSHGDPDAQDQRGPAHRDRR